MQLSERQVELKKLIDDGAVPTILNASSIWYKDNVVVPYHWGDIETLGYGRTVRRFDREGEKVGIDRYYTGPQRIVLTYHGIMEAGDCSEGDK
jgi:hypothetical protein